MNYPSSELVIDPVLIRKYDAGGPGYTAYPTVDRFVEAFSETTFRYWLSNRNIGGITRPLALHFHGPSLTESVAPTASRRRTMRSAASSLRYRGCVEREIVLSAGLLGERHVSQVHWGSFSPVLAERGALHALDDVLKSEFAVASDCEISIEVDPDTVPAGFVERLHECGCNRVSLNLQHFDGTSPGRAHPGALTHRIVEEAKAGKFSTVKFDIAYGLPGQTLQRFSSTLEALLAFDPDRIMLERYAHLPSRPGVRADFPNTETRLQMLTLALGRLLRAGYLYVGMNHFAKPDDELVLAQRQGRLQLSGHGYTSRPACDLLGFGAGAISRIGPACCRNLRDLRDYGAALDVQRLPVQSGLVLSKDDLVRRAIMDALLCQFRLSIESIEASYLLNFNRYFASELADLATLEDEGMVEIQPDWLIVTPKGRLLVKTVCMVFDRYLRDGRRWAGASAMT